MVAESLQELRNEFLQLCKSCKIPTKDTEIENRYRCIEININNFKGVIILLNVDEDHSIKDWVRGAIKLTKNYNKVLLLVSGESVPGEDRAFADQYDVIIWDHEHLKILLENVEEDLEDAVEKILGSLGITSYLDPNINYKSPGMLGQ